MKKVILVMCLAVSFSSFSQNEIKDNRISFGVYQDPSLAILKNHENKPFTTDMRLEFILEGKSGDIGSGLLGLTFEYGDFSQFSFTRYGIQSGYNFRNMNFFNLFDYQLSLLGGVGLIMRGGDNINYMSFELTTEFSYFITNWLSIDAKLTMMQRGDLSEKYSDASGSYRPWDWKPNGYLGVKFYIYN